MHSSPRSLYASMSSVVPTTPSPKRKPRPIALRQQYALPSIHQFEPIRRTSTRPNEDGGEATTSLMQPTGQFLSPDAKSSEKLSPRFRPHPPMPAAISSRTDQDLYRYNQGMKQRMSIRPLFEQRREEEADIARGILVSRETDPAWSRHGRRDPLECDTQSPRDEDEGCSANSRREMTYSASRRCTTPVTASELSGKFRNSETPRSKPSRPQAAKEQGTIPTTASETWVDPSIGQSGASVPVDKHELSESDWSPIPQPPSSAGPSRLHLEETGHMMAAQVSNSDEQSPCDITPPPHDHHFSLEASRVIDTSAQLADVSLVANLDSTTLYTPFLEKRGSKMNWLALKSSPVQRSPTTKDDKTNAHIVKAAPCFKILWRDNKSFTTSEDGTRSFDIGVLLDSGGKCHIRIREVGDEDCEEKVLISESDLIASAKAQPDVAVMTPKWARWLLSRLGRDVEGHWFLRIQDISTMNESCVFSEDVLIAPLPTDGKNEDDLVVGVSMYVLNSGEQGPEDLLVHARNHAAASSSFTELVLKSRELEALGKTFGFITASSHPNEVTHEDMRRLLRDDAFLRRAVAESKTLKLALRSGLNTSQATDSVSDLPFRTGSRHFPPTSSGSSRETMGSPISSPAPSRALTSIVAEYEAQGLIYGSQEIKSIVSSNELVAEVAFLSQAFCEDAVAAALRWLQRSQAVTAYVENYVKDATEDLSKMSESVRDRIEAAKTAKLEDLAVRAIIEDMISDFIAVECRLELHHVKFSGGYDDFYASKVQSAFRMSYQRRDYVYKRNMRNRAVRLIQALQRGIMARRRYCEMRIEREKYLFFGFRSSLHHATSRIEDPRQRAMDMAQETEKRRQTFLMQVLHGYIVEHDFSTPFHISPELVQNIFNEYGVVVGCSPTLGDIVATILISSRQSQSHSKMANIDVSTPKLFGSGEIHAALLTALRMQYDDTYGLSSNLRQIEAREQSPIKALILADLKSTDRGGLVSNENTPPRWLLKASAPFQRANRNRVAALRLARKSAGQRAAHLVALDYRNLLRDGFNAFDKCRAIWEDNIRTRKQQTRQYDTFSLEELVQYALDRLTSAVKDWGLDPEPLFEALNLCLLHRLGKQAIALAEDAFNRFAQGVNVMHGKRSVYSLREEISQELEEFESLLALRCLNIASDTVVTVPPSELLHTVLNGKIDDEYTRHALPSVLPIAGINEKTQLAEKMIRGYANVMYGEALNAICWSCLDTAENVTVEAAQFLERITRRSTDDNESFNGPTKALIPPVKKSITERALYLLTGSQALRFLHFLAKTSHFNKPLQRRVLQHLAPHARDYELYRLASVACSIDSFDIVSRLFDENFDARSIHSATRFWVQYGALYGEEQAELARETCRPPHDTEAVAHHAPSDRQVVQESDPTQA